MTSRTPSPIGDSAEEVKSNYPQSSGSDSDVSLDIKFPIQLSPPLPSVFSQHRSKNSRYDYEPVYSHRLGLDFAPSTERDPSPFTLDYNLPPLPPLPPKRSTANHDNIRRRMAEHLESSKELLGAMDMQIQTLNLTNALKEVEIHVYRGEDDKAREKLCDAFELAKNIGNPQAIEICEIWETNLKETREINRYAESDSEDDLNSLDSSLFGARAQRRPNPRRRSTGFENPWEEYEGESDDTTYIPYEVDDDDDDDDDEEEEEEKEEGTDIEATDPDNDPSNPHSNSNPNSKYKSKQTQTEQPSSSSSTSRRAHHKSTRARIPSLKRPWDEVDQDRVLRISHHIRTTTTRQPKPKPNLKTESRIMDRNIQKPLQSQAKPWLIQDEDLENTYSPQESNFIQEELMDWDLAWEKKNTVAQGGRSRVRPMQSKFTFSMDVMEMAPRPRKTNLFPEQDWEFIADAEQWRVFREKMRDVPVTLDYLEWEGFMMEELAREKVRSKIG